MWTIHIPIKRDPPVPKLLGLIIEQIVSMQEAKYPRLVLESLCNKMFPNTFLGSRHLVVWFIFLQKLQKSPSKLFLIFASIKSLPFVSFHCQLWMPKRTEFGFVRPTPPAMTDVDGKPRSTSKDARMTPTAMSWSPQRPVRWPTALETSLNVLMAKYGT